MFTVNKAHFHSDHIGWDIIIPTKYWYTCIWHLAWFGVHSNSIHGVIAIFVIRLELLFNTGALLHPMAFLGNSPSVCTFIANASPTSGLWLCRCVLNLTGVIDRTVLVQFWICLWLVKSTKECFTYMVLFRHFNILLVTVFLLSL